MGANMSEELKIGHTISFEITSVKQLGIVNYFDTQEQESIKYMSDKIFSTKYEAITEAMSVLMKIRESCDE